MVRYYDSNAVLGPTLHPNRAASTWVLRTLNDDAIILPPTVAREALGRTLHNGVRSALKHIQDAAHRANIKTRQEALNLLNSPDYRDDDKTGWHRLTAPLVAQRIDAGQDPGIIHELRRRGDEIAAEGRARILETLKAADIHLVEHLPPEQSIPYNMTLSRAESHFDMPTQMDDLAHFAETLVLAACHTDEPALLITEDVDYAAAARRALKDPRVQFVNTGNVEILKIPPNDRDARKREGARYQLPTPLASARKL